MDRPRISQLGRDRPTNLRSSEAVGKRGSSRPSLQEPAQLPGPQEPASRKAGPPGEPLPRSYVCVGMDVAKAP